MRKINIFCTNKHKMKLSFYYFCFVLCFSSIDTIFNNKYEKNVTLFYLVRNMTLKENNLFISAQLENDENNI